MRALVFVFALLTVLTATAQQVGDTVRLRAAHELGVPLHRAARSSMFTRVADRSEVYVLEIANRGRWLRVETETGIGGWIVERYVDEVVTGSTSPPNEDSGLDELAV